ncbi:40S ribosomal protein S16 [Galemys pyrenaicus]|uniref:40S ribosomal protein S16 n=1 Tax=Galemys pyrenaicus TaxID=202257 RepID=A0A8J6DLW7_GALPY|nr:40S ribosomal protein S16 [Galemys pyrenaicus]
MNKSSQQWQLPHQDEPEAPGDHQVIYIQNEQIEPGLPLGNAQLMCIDVRMYVKNCDHVAQFHSICQFIFKALVAQYQKYENKASKKEIKDILNQYDWILLVTNPVAENP